MSHDKYNGICVICQRKVYMPWFCVFGELEYNICEECEIWLDSLQRCTDDCVTNESEGE
jgi:hypothetical protein